MPEQSKGMPSILGDVAPPFSAPTHVTGVADDFPDFHTQWLKNKTPETNTQLLQRVQPVIDTAVSSYGGASASPSFKSRARLMALKAMDNYDPKRGNVRTHLLSQLQSLRRLSAQEQNIISIPEQVGLDYQKLHAAETELRDSLSRDPSDEELADVTGLSVKRLRKVRAFNQPIATGSTVNETSEENYDGDIASTIPNQNRSADAWMDFVYGDLTPTDRLIMDMTLGRNGRRRATTQDIAARLNITPGAVSQRAAKIQALIDKRYEHQF
jgi:DNA-directed RNA polymerase specialized sigma subunit